MRDGLLPHESQTCAAQSGEINGLQTHLWKTIRHFHERPRVNIVILYCERLQVNLSQALTFTILFQISQGLETWCRWSSQNRARDMIHSSRCRS